MLFANPKTMQITEKYLLFVNKSCLTGHNKMVQQASWQAIDMCIFVAETLAVYVVHAVSKMLHLLPPIWLG